MFNFLVYLLALLLLCFSATITLAQETYEDPNGLFSAPVPAGWTVDSSDGIAVMSNPEGTATISLLAVESETVESGILAALTQLDPAFASEPIQSVTFPISSGEWTQNIYVVGTEVIAALGVQHGEHVVALIARGNQAALQTVNSTILEVLNGITLIGAEVPTPPYADTSKFTESEVTFGLEDWPLDAILTTPIGDGPFPAVVLVHGSGPNDRDETLGGNKIFRDLAWGLATQGIAVLRYDKRTFTHGAEMTGEITLDDETTDDALLAVAYLRVVETIDSERIFVLGHSQGGMLAPRMAERDPEIAGLILLAGLARNFEVSLAEQLEYINSLPGANPALTTGLETLADQIRRIRAGEDALEVTGDASMAAYLQSMVDYNPTDTIKNVEMPILVLQGERDYQVTMADFVLWQQALNGHPNVQFITYNGLAHNFINTGGETPLALPAELAEAGFMDENVINDIAEWILSIE